MRRAIPKWVYGGAERLNAIKLLEVLSSASSSQPSIGEVLGSPQEGHIQEGLSFPRCRFTLIPRSVTAVTAAFLLRRSTAERNCSPAALRSAGYESIFTPLMHKPYRWPQPSATEIQK